MNKVPFYDEKNAENYQRELRRRGYTTTKEKVDGRFLVSFAPKQGASVPESMKRAKAV